MKYFQIPHILLTGAPLELWLRIVGPQGSAFLRGSPLAANSSRTVYYQEPAIMSPSIRVGCQFAF